MNQQKLKIYRYYFEGKKHPLCIVAYDRVEARTKLSIGVMPYMNTDKHPTLLGETVCVPIIGQSKMYLDDKVFIWVGLEDSPNGWKEEK